MGERDEIQRAAAAFAEQLQHGVPCQCRWEPGQIKAEPPKLTECAYHAGQRLQLMRLVAEITHQQPVSVKILTATPNQAHTQRHADDEP